MRSVRHAVLGWLLVLGWCLSGCEKEVKVVPATQVILTLRSDLGAELASVEAIIYDVRGEKRGDSHVFELQGERSLPLSFAVVPTLPETTQFLVVLSGKDAMGVELVQTKAIVSFVPKKSVGVQLWLHAGCKGTICSSGETCTTSGTNEVGCASVPVLETQPVVPGQELEGAVTEVAPVERVDASHAAPDAGLDLVSDAGDAPPDAAPDAGTDGGDGSAPDAAVEPPSGPCVGNPNKAVCVENVLHQCDAQGQSTVPEVCASARQCQLGIINRTCAPCDPGTFKCNGTRLERCANDGSKWEMLKTCDSEALCNSVAGDCIAGACTAATRVCMGDDLYGCSEDLTQLTRLKGCDAGLCDQVNGECDLCTANARRCSAGYAEVCDSQGQNLTRNQCTGSTPKCSAGQCVQCTAASDCPNPSNQCLQATCNGATARCGTANKAAHQACTGGVCNGSGACVQCVDDSDCKSSSAKKCLNARCVQCKADTDCPATYECNTSNNTCQKVSIAGTGTSCLSNSPPSGGMCGSYFCGVTPAKFSRAFDPASVCGPDAAFMCEGSLDRIVQDCSTRAGTMIFLSTEEQIAMTNSCVKADSSVVTHSVKDACIQCFVGAARCCINNSNCLSACVLLFDTQAKCDAARKAAGCVNPIFECTGLPNPL